MNPNETTTEDLVGQYPDGQESELLPAGGEVEDIEPYALATPVSETWSDDTPEAA